MKTILFEVKSVEQNFIEMQETLFPYDAIHVDFVLKKAA